MNPEKKRLTLEDVSDEEIDAATDEIKYDTDTAEGGQGMLRGASTPEMIKGIDAVLPDSAKDNPLEGLEDPDLAEVNESVETAFEENPDARLIEAAGKTAQEISAVFASGETGDARDAKLDEARDNFFQAAKLEGKTAKEIMETADVLRSQIITIGETYRSQMNVLQVGVETLKKQVEEKRKEIPIYKEIGNEELATERERESSDLERQAAELAQENKKDVDDLNSKAQELMAFAANSLESDELLDSVPSDTLDRYIEKLSELKPKNLEEFSPLVAEGAKAIELELLGRAEQGEFSKEKVETLLGNMQRRLEKVSGEKSEEFKAQHDKPAEGETEFEASDEDIDALFG